MSFSSHVCVLCVFPTATAADDNCFTLPLHHDEALLKGAGTFTFGPVTVTDGLRSDAPVLEPELALSSLTEPRRDVALSMLPPLSHAPRLRVSVRVSRLPHGRTVQASVWWRSDVDAAAKVDRWTRLADCDLQGGA